MKQREETITNSEKYLAPALRSPFEKKFRWRDGGIQEIKRPSNSNSDPNADTENRRATRNKQESKEAVQKRARRERAEKRRNSDEQEEPRSKYVDYDSESEEVC